METTFEGWNEWTELANCNEFNELYTEKLSYMLEAIGACDYVEKLFFRTSKDRESCEVKFTFCEELFEFQSRDDGTGWGPIDHNSCNVYSVGERFEAMLWIAWTLVKRLQDG